MDNVSIQDLISLSYEQKPIEFNNAFSALMADKITKAIDDKKIEVAQTMFTSQEVETEPEQNEEE